MPWEGIGKQQGILRVLNGFRICSGQSSRASLQGVQEMGVSNPHSIQTEALRRAEAQEQHQQPQFLLLPEALWPVFQTECQGGLGILMR